MRSIVQKPRAKRVGLGLKYKQYLLEYNSEVQAIKIKERCCLWHKVYHVQNGTANII